MEAEADVGTEQMKEESLFGVVDIILLVGLLLAGAYWLLKNRKKQDTLSTTTRSYTIQ